MEEKSSLRLTFWGVRGYTPTPQRENLEYGGNTICVEVRLPNGEVFVFDGGTGLRNLGTSLLNEFPDQKLTPKVFLTHFHWDHIQGIPFFPVLYHEQNTVTFHSMRFPGGPFRRRGAGSGLEEALKLQMENPYFPISSDFIPATKDFVEIEPNPIKFGDLTISPFPLNHPGKALGYRIERNGAAIVYATDLEHGHQQLDSTLRDFSQGADLLIFDSQFTPEDYETHKGWGHSTWQEACDVANQANVKQLALFHHNPGYDDKFFRKIVERSRRSFENTIGAREGLSLTF